MKRSHRGFTLIEILVVLIMVAMVSGVLFQALERSYSLQRRFGTELFKVQQGDMAINWYRQTVQGLYPDRAGAPDVFRGDASGFSGLSTNPLGEDFGGPTAVQWKLVTRVDAARTDLVYLDRKAESVVLTWRGSKAKFVYYDEAQVAHDRWPPPLGLFPQLPRQIQIEANDGGDPIAIVASPMGPAEPILRPQDLFLTLP